MPDLTTKDALLERMVTATEDLAVNIPAKFEQYLPLSGGTMTGPIKGSNTLTLTADDGEGNSADLVINNNGSATLDGNNIITSALTGSVLEASGSSTGVNTAETLCTIATHPAGVWLITSFVELNYGGSSIYVNRISIPDKSNITVRTSSTSGGGSCAFRIETLTENQGVSVIGIQTEAGTMNGKLQMVRLA